MAQKSIREEFQAFVDSGVWQGEDEFTKNFPVGNIADWFLSKIREKVEEAEKKVKECHEGQTKTLGHKVLIDAEALLSELT